MKSALDQLIAGEKRRQAGRLLAAGVSALVAALAAVVLLGLSGWFITAAAMAGAAGLAAAQTFNFLLPSAMIRLLAILRTAFRYVERLMGHKAALGALAAIRPRLFAGLAAAPPSDALSYSAGEASARFIQDVDAVEGIFIRQSARIGAAASLSAGVALTFLAGWGAAALLALSALFAGACAWWMSRRVADGAAAEMRRAVGRLKDVAAHMAAAAPELRCYGLEAFACDRVAAEDEQLTERRLRLAKIQGLSALIQAALTGAAAAGVLIVARDASPPLAALAALAAAVTMEGVQALAKSLEQDADARAAAARLEPVVRHVPSPATGLKLTAPSLELSDAPLRLQVGSRLGISGPSGIGKTTLLEQLLGLRPAPRGALRLGDLDLADLDPQVARASFAYAGQDPVLLSATVRENLRLAAPAADEAALWSALKDAALDERVRRLPLGLDTWLGDGADQLSGGERRRLALARALLRSADWLLLDEPTEGLDAATEAKVLEGLDRRLAATGQGLVVVSHRPGPLAICGRVLGVRGLEADGRVAFAQQALEHQP